MPVSQSAWVFSAAIKGPAVSLKLSCVVAHKNQSGNASQVGCVIASWSVKRRWNVKGKLLLHFCNYFIIIYDLQQMSVKQLLEIILCMYIFEWEKEGKRLLFSNTVLFISTGSKYSTYKWLTCLVTPSLTCVFLEAVEVVTKRVLGAS